MKIYSITEIVEATNNILNPKELINKSNKLIETKAKTFENIEKPLVLKTEIPEVKKDEINSLNYKIKIKPEVKDNMINELYLFLKKKLKKNTLKIIIDEQIEIKNLKNSIIFLKKNKDELIDRYKLLENRYRYTQEILNQTNNKNNELIIENNDLKVINRELKDNLVNAINEKDELVKQNEIKENEIKEVELKNRSFVINNEKLKNTISRYIVNTKKIQEKLNYVENNKNLEVEEINKKVKFYQDENIRLSGELLSFKRKNDTIKVNLSDIEIEKEEISNKIKELSRSIDQKTNIVKTTFTKENNTEPSKNIESLNDKEQKSLDEVISRIFNKI